MINSQTQFHCYLQIAACKECNFANLVLLLILWTTYLFKRNNDFILVPVSLLENVFQIKVYEIETSTFTLCIVHCRSIDVKDCNVKMKCNSANTVLLLTLSTTCLCERNENYPFISRLCVLNPVSYNILLTQKQVHSPFPLFHSFRYVTK